MLFKQQNNVKSKIMDASTGCRVQTTATSVPTLKTALTACPAALVVSWGMEIHGSGNTLTGQASARPATRTASTGETQRSR